MLYNTLIARLAQYDSFKQQARFSLHNTPIVLTIAGSDSGAGAGIQADIKTGSALGVYVVSALTAVTAQNTRGVSHVHDLPLQSIRSQLDALFDDFAIAAIKIGMLSQTSVIELVAEYLERSPQLPVVLDPVMVATSGDQLLADTAVDMLRQRLLPQTTVITPNIPEAQTLLGINSIEGRDDMEQAARQLLQIGARAVLLKGGHLSAQAAGGQCDDLLYVDQPVWFSAPRIATTNTHGTGCSLSSAVAAGLAKGLDLDDAVREAKNYLQQALVAAKDLHIGQGNGPLNHFFNIRVC